MLWKKRKSVSTELPAVGVGDTLHFDSAPAAPLGSEADRALDAVATLLRLYGKYAFDTDAATAGQTSAECVDWATRITLGQSRAEEERQVPSRDAPAALGHGVSRPVPTAVRDWAGLFAFVNERRRGESEYVVRSLKGFRETVLYFANCLTHALGDDRESDARITARLDTLSVAIQTRDPGRIQSEAAAVVEAVRGAIAQRRKREEEQIWALGERLRELREELSEARKKAEIDALTQLFNRAAFDAYLQDLATLGALLGGAPWLLLIDLDHFKAVNDQYGHPAGDAVLRQVSDCLSRTFLRKEDFVCRYGGEEFAAILLDVTEKQLLALVDRLMASVRGLTVVHGSERIRVTLSLGIAALEPGEPVSSWLARADAALYRAKHEGRDRYELASPRAAG